MNYNVEKLKVVIAFAIELYEDLKVKLQDGKLQVIEILQLLPFLKDLWIIMKDVGEIKKAYLALKPAEKQELSIYFNEKFDLPNDKVELMIESFFEMLLGLSTFFNALSLKSNIQAQITNVEEKGE